MKIGIILSATPGYSETFFNSKIKGLQENGYSVKLFAQKVSPDFTICQVRKLPDSIANVTLPLRVVSVFFSLIPFVRNVARFFVLEIKDEIPIQEIFKRIYFNAPLFKSKLDWLHYGFGTLAIGRENIANAINAKMAVSFRGFDIGVFPIKHPKCYDKVWDKVDKIHVISNDIEELLYTHNFKNQCEVVKITPAIDIKYFKSDIETESSLPLKIVTVARLHWKKGLDYTLEALSILKNKGVDFHYTIIGEGPEEEYLKFTAYQLNLTEQCTFTGRLSHQEIRTILKQSCLYIQYSVQEGFCNAVLEAQAMGLLCIVSNAEGLSENVLHEQTGWVVPLRNPKLLSNKIQSVFSMTQKEKSITISKAKERIKNEFDIGSQKEAFVEFYSNKV